MEEMRILSPTAILGYGFPEESFREGMNRKPHVIAVDAGSTDPGPYYLGAGLSFTDRNAVKRDLAIMIPEGLKAGIPVIIGSAGGSGAKPHLDWNVEIIMEIAREQNLSFKLAVIPADVSREVVSAKLKAGEISPLKPAPDLTQEEIDRTGNIVAQMGVEPFIKALDGGAQVIVAGRAYDPTVFAALAIKNGYDRGLATHLGKILECAAIAASPGSGSDCMLGTLGKDYFIVEALSKLRKCTTISVAAHTLYEKTNPYILPGPGGILDLHECAFTQESETLVKVTGTKFIESDGYFIKLEGAKKIGYRTVSLAACKDPVMISKIDDIVEAVKAKVKSNFQNFGITEFFLDFKLYGKSGVMGMFKNIASETCSELGIVIEAVAEKQEIANTICSFARSTMLHFGYEGRISTAGNLAFPFSPSDFKVGEVYEFSMYHIMKVEDPAALFPISYVDIAGGKEAR
ncbi:MAG: DUF1446 domain-containing protein [Treponema sp.]|nr:DUF1446 domain-containing protein [Treponema sp.]